mmetsp:Transcript_8904/g.13366  ORF Transcript_8904/g.13366 Transcript_8904/m.13366 type:complete len:125 (-) Transcript_8904:397-771(-)
MKTYKEEPNTKSVIVWPDEILQEIKRVEEYDSWRRKRKGLLRRGSSSVESRSVFYTEEYEYYVFVLVGSVLWILLAHTTLKWHKFPFHMHTIECTLIYTFPIFLIILTLYFLDFGIERNKTRVK